MKQYRGMFKMYFDIKGGLTAAAQKAEELRNSHSSINLDIHIHDSAAFIVYCDEMLAQLYSIRRMSQKIDTLSTLLPKAAMAQFIRQALIEEIHQTNEIENVQSTRKEISDEIRVIENGRKGKRFDGMIRKYKLLIENDCIPLVDCRDIRELYDNFVLDEVVKEDPNDAPDGMYFRTKPVSVVKSSKEIHEGVYPETALNRTMELALAFLNDEDYDPLIRAAAFHYLFGYMHPFYNGNGRMTRFISSYILAKNGVPSLAALRLSYVIKSNRSAYYALFKDTNDKRNFGDLTCFVVRFLSFVSDACKQVLDFLTEKKQILDHYLGLVDRLDMEKNAKKLLYILVQATVCEWTGLSIQEMSNTMGCTTHMIRKYLGGISEYCTFSKIGTAKCYTADLEKIEQSFE